MAYLSQSAAINDSIQSRMQCIATIKGLSLCPPWNIEKYGDLSEPLDPFAVFTATAGLPVLHSAEKITNLASMANTLQR